MNAQGPALVPANSSNGTTLSAAHRRGPAVGPRGVSWFFTVNIRNRNTRAAYARARLPSWVGVRCTGLVRSPAFREWNGSGFEVHGSQI
jgi:hypothetical protein